MKTETYEKLLSELGIPLEWSPEKRVSVIEEKYNDALNLLNVAQQKDDKDWIRELEESIEKMGDALEYTNDLQKSLSSGLVLDTRDDRGQKSRCSEKPALKSGKKEKFWYHGDCYTSIGEFAPVLKKQFSEGAEMNKAPLFVELFESEEYQEAFDAWFAKVDGGRHQREMSELKEAWFAFKKEYFEEFLTFDMQNGSLQDLQLPADDMEKKLVLLNLRYEILSDLTVANFGMNLPYRTLAEAVLRGAVRVGFLREEDLEQLPMRKAVGEEIAHLVACRENMERQMAELMRAIECMDGKRPAVRWNEEYWDEKQPGFLEKIEDRAEIGDARAQNKLGDWYLRGDKGFVQNLAEAAQWYRKAGKGYWEAYKQYEKELHEYRKVAAEQGYADAQFWVGFMYDDGREVAQDYEKAAAWYKKAAEQGHSAAQNALGRMYQEGRGVAKDVEKAAEWYKKAAEQGNKFAQHSLEELRKQS